MQAAWAAFLDRHKQPLHVFGSLLKALLPAALFEGCYVEDFR